MEIKIEKGIEIPKLKGTYPFAEMEIGDSFELPCDNEKKLRSQRSNIAHALLKYNKDAKQKISITTRNTTLFNLRVWRTK